MTNLRNQVSKCDNCVSRKKEVKDIRESVSKFAKGKNPIFDSIKSKDFLK